MLCVTFSAMNWTKYGINWWSPGSSRSDARPAARYSGWAGSRIEEVTLSKYSCSSLLRMCLTNGFVALLEAGWSAIAASVWLGAVPVFGSNESSVRLSVEVEVEEGFCGMVGWTPSRASQCAARWR